nr:MAG TPA: major capsid protein [Caudoviricetes sp.]
MNNNLLNGLQLYRGKRFSDLVDENMISNALLTNPHQVSGLLSLVFGTKDDGVSTAIDMITGGLGKTMIIDNREYEWSVMIDGDHAVNIMWAKCDGVDVTENTAAGLNGTPIYIALEEKWYGWHKLSRFIQ